MNSKKDKESFQPSNSRGALPFGLNSTRDEKSFQPCHFRGAPFGARPLPPVTNFEKNLFEYLKGSGAHAAAAGVDDDEEFPVGVVDALTSEAITVVQQVRATGGGGGGGGGGRGGGGGCGGGGSGGGGGGGGAAGGAAGGEDAGWQAWVKFDAPTGDESSDGEVESEPAAGGHEGASAVLQSLGIEVDRTIGSSGGPSFVTSVVHGSVAGRWGVTPGMQVVEAGLSSITVAMITLFRGPPPLEEGGVPQIQPVVAAPAKYIGGMALVDETHDGTLTKMLLSVFVRSKATLLESAAAWAQHQRPSSKAELKESQAKQRTFREGLFESLGFDIKQKKIRGLPSLLQVDSIVEGFLADLYGLRVGDTLLSVNAFFLVGVSTDGFVARAAEGLRACASGMASDEVLRFCICRKTIPQPSREVSGRKVSISPRKDGMTPNISTGEGAEPHGRTPAWDEPSPNDAVVPLPPAVKAAAAKAAAQERSQRAEVRARPDWWGPRREGSAMNTMKLRPAFTASSPEGEEPETGDRGVEETKGGDPEPRGATGGEPVPRGAFLAEEIQTGDDCIPAGVQLLSVRGVCCRNMTFSEARDVALSAGSDDAFVFDGV